MNRTSMKAMPGTGAGGQTHFRVYIVARRSKERPGSSAIA